MSETASGASQALHCNPVPPAYGSQLMAKGKYLLRMVFGWVPLVLCSSAPTDKSRPFLCGGPAARLHPRVCARR